jgi:nitroreductase
MFAHTETRCVGERIRGCVETDRQRVRPRARDVERISPVSRPGIDDDAGERAGEVSDLTDVDVDEALTDDLTHDRNGTAALRLSRRVHRLVRVLHKALRAADGTRNVEPPVEVPEILRSLERLLKGRLGKTQRGSEALELALIDLPCGHQRADATVRYVIDGMRTVRQIRQYAPEPVPDEAIKQLLQVARWTGSSRNTQPWHFIVVTDKAKLGELSQLRAPINWLAAAPLGIAIVLEGDGVSEAYDEGRVTERILIAAHSLGYGGGVAWFGDAKQQAEAKRILAIPAERTARSIVMVGRPTSTKDPRPNPRRGGRKPLRELVSYDRFGSAR